MYIINSKFYHNVTFLMVFLGLRMSSSGAAKEFLYPYSYTGKVRQFPWRWYWQNARTFRFSVYAWFICLPAIMSINKAGKPLARLYSVQTTCSNSDQSNCLKYKLYIPAATVDFMKILFVNVSTCHDL